MEQKKSTGVIIFVLALVGACAAAMLLITELKHLENPNAALGCDVNSLVGCSSSLMTWQAHLVGGIPNSLLGLAGFAACIGIGFALATKWQPPKWFWWIAALAALGALSMVGFFLHQTVTVFHSFCPYCVVVWAATIPLAVIFSTEGLRSTSGLGRIIVRERWAAIVVLYVIVSATALIEFIL